MDVNTLAKSIVDQSTGDEARKDAPKKKNPRASVRGTARAKALTPEQRKTIAEKAAAARWQKK